jgi:hypothetical protein
MKYVLIRSTAGCYRVHEPERIRGGARRKHELGLTIQENAYLIGHHPVPQTNRMSVNQNREN